MEKIYFGIKKNLDIVYYDLLNEEESRSAHINGKWALLCSWEGNSQEGLRVELYGSGSVEDCAFGRKVFVYVKAAFSNRNALFMKLQSFKPLHNHRQLYRAMQWPNHYWVIIELDRWAVETLYVIDENGRAVCTITRDGCAINHKSSAQTKMKPIRNLGWGWTLNDIESLVRLAMPNYQSCLELVK